MKPIYDGSNHCDRCKENVGCYEIGGEWLCNDCYEEELLIFTPHEEELLIFTPHEEENEEDYED